ncbi:unnamed protein product [Albugo candida]|uniref:RxLR effector protein n=1 Tax=Albugo candida TaxID=65357 RepID=A0A024FTK3_9STRA|nr:unnamed protein product [Albugo candida]|eukprot:CCI10440.1 unnamed protein product [Albugo candida]
MRFLTVVIIASLANVSFTQSPTSNPSITSKEPLTSEQLADLVEEVKGNIGKNEALRELFNTVDLEYVRNLPIKDARSYIDRMLFESSEEKEKTRKSTQEEVRESVTKESNAFRMSVSTLMVLGCPVVLFLL